MTNSSVSLHELRRRIYVKAKAQTSWRFWGLYVHVCKTETLREAYRLAKENNGAPGIDGVTFEAIEEQGVVSFVEHLRKELIGRTYRPLRARKGGPSSATTVASQGGREAASRGTGQATSGGERGEESSSGPDERRELRISWLWVPPCAESCRAVDAVAHATAEKAHGSAAKTQGRIPSLSLPAC